MLNRRHVINRLAVAAVSVTATLSFPSLAVAQYDGANFPSKPITIIAHTGAGSSTDIFARQLAKAAEPVFGQPVVVVNRPGGSGATQMALLEGSNPDGYTVGVNTISHVTAMQTNLSGVFDIDDFAWISLNQFDPFVTVVAADSPYESLADFVDAGVQLAHDGGDRIKVGGFGTVGAAHNIAFNILADKAEMPFTWVGFEGGPQAMTALLGGHIDAVNTNPGPALQFVESGRVRVLGVLDDRRLESLPDVPTYAEAGFPVDTSWKQVRGLYGDKDIPEDIQEKLAQGFFKAMQAPEFRQYMQTAGLTVGDLGPERYTQFIHKIDQTAGDWIKRLESEQ